LVEFAELFGRHDEVSDLRKSIGEFRMCFGEVYGCARTHFAPKDGSPKFEIRNIQSRFQLKKMEGDLVQLRLIPFIVTQLYLACSLEDHVVAVAEYIHLLNAENYPPLLICSSIKEVVDIPVEELFILSIYSEIERLQSGEKK